MAGEIALQLYALRLLNGETDTNDLHDFVMEALVEGRIDLDHANRLLGQGLVPAEAYEVSE